MISFSRPQGCLANTGSKTGSLLRRVVPDPLNPIGEAVEGLSGDGTGTGKILRFARIYVKPA